MFKQLIICRAKWMIFLIIPSISYSEPRTIVLTNPIQGSPPILTKIGIEISTLRNLESDNPLSSQYAYLNVENDELVTKHPIWGAKIRIIDFFYDKMNTYLDNDNDVDTKNYQIKWYLFEQNKKVKQSVIPWENHDLLNVKTSQIIPSYYTEISDKYTSSNGSILTVPKEAIGKKIALSLTTNSQTGFPAEGNTLFIEDLRYYYEQSIQKDTNTNNVNVITQKLNEHTGSSGEVLDLPQFMKLYYDKPTTNTKETAQVKYSYSPSMFCLTDRFIPPTLVDVCKSTNYSLPIFKNSMEWKCYSTIDPTLTKKIGNWYGKKTVNNLPLSYPFTESGEVVFTFPKDSLDDLNSQKGLSCIFLAKNGAGVANKEDIKFFNSHNFIENGTLNSQTPIYPTAIIKNFKINTFSANKNNATSLSNPDKTPMFSVGVPIHFMFDIKAAHFPDKSKDLFFPGDRFKKMEDDGLETDLTNFSNYTMPYFKVYSVPQSFFIGKDLSSQSALNYLEESGQLKNYPLRINNLVFTATQNTVETYTSPVKYTPIKEDIGRIIVVVIFISPAHASLNTPYLQQGLKKTFVGITSTIQQ